VVVRTIEEIRRTPAGLLTDEEIGMLDPAGQEYVTRFRAQKAREAACLRHERVSTATREQTNRGNHRGRCMHCGRDMSWDSGD